MVRNATPCVHLVTHQGKLLSGAAICPQTRTHIRLANTGASCSRVSIVCGQGHISTLVTPISAKPAIVSVIWSIEPVIATPKPVASADFALPGSTNTPADLPIEDGSRPIPSQIRSNCSVIALNASGKLLDTA